jgi:ABC-type phosphate/phosphonate transport system substrate-binding protein
MSVRLNYFGVPGRAAYFGRSKNIQNFSLWSKDNDSEHLVYVYIPKSQANRDAELKRFCIGAQDETSGFMVPLQYWESKVSPEGMIRS